MTPSLGRRTALLLVFVAGVSCGRGTDGCDLDLHIKFSEVERVLDVGDHFTPVVELSGCGGRERVSDAFMWHTTDSAVVSVDPRSGIVTGLAPGRAFVTVRGQAHGHLGEVTVFVRSTQP